MDSCYGLGIDELFPSSRIPNEPKIGKYINYIIYYIVKYILIRI